MPWRFSVKVEVIDPGPGIWKTARVHVFEDDGAGTPRIGSYDRNHAGWCESTFAPFAQDGRFRPEPRDSLPACSRSPICPI
jgi:hypothetical protein